MSASSVSIEHVQDLQAAQAADMLWRFREHLAAHRLPTTQKLHSSTDAQSMLLSCTDIFATSTSGKINVRKIFVDTPNEGASDDLTSV